MPPLENERPRLHPLQLKLTGAEKTFVAEVAHASVRSQADVLKEGIRVLRRIGRVLNDTPPEVLDRITAREMLTLIGPDLTLPPTPIPEPDS